MIIYIYLVLNNYLSPYNDELIEIPGINKFFSEGKLNIFSTIHSLPFGDGIGLENAITCFDVESTTIQKSHSKTIFIGKGKKVILLKI